MRNSTLLTEFNDISQRLEYLVTNSSQMVFVTGEDIAIQQGFVEAFLGQQSASANVAFLPARRGKPGSYYRQQFFQQFAIPTAKQKGALVQAYAARQEKDKPVLIAITGAENLPEDILRELWDLVLQNRFARTAEQINILLFGDQEWAEEVKSWLPTNNNDKPVLLTTQTLEYGEEHELEGDIDAMIASRRKLFHDRMKTRAQSSEHALSPFATWWFKLLLASVFLLSFGSILLWQYFDVSKAAVSEFAQFLFQAEVEAAGANSNSADADQEQQTNSAVLQALNTSGGVAGSENTASMVELPASENARVADNFSDALSSFSKPVGQVQDTTGTDPQRISVQIKPVPGQNSQMYESEFIVDITPEQLRQLQQMTASGETPEVVTVDNSTATALHSPREAFGTMQTQLQQPLAGKPDTSNDRDPLDAAIMQALEEMAQIEAQMQGGQQQLGLDTGQAANVAEPANFIEQATSAALDVVAENIDNPSGAVLDAVSQQLGLEQAQPEVLQQAPVGGSELAADVDVPQADAFIPIEQGGLVSSAFDNSSIQAEVGTPVNGGLDTAVVQPAVEGAVQDYAIEDIPAPALPPRQTDSQPEATAQRAAPTGLADQAQLDSFMFDEPRLLAQPDNHYVLQITGISTLSLLNEYLIDHNLRDTVWIYQTQRYGGDWFVVLLNQSYASLDAARAASGLVQGLLPNAQPFAKALTQVRAEITGN